MQARGGGEPTAAERLEGCLAQLYGAERARTLSERLGAAAAVTREQRRGGSSSDVRRPVVCVYPDHVTADDAPPLATLRHFLEETLGDTLREVVLHVLPPYLADGDDGFAVVDHRTVHPRFGTWSDLAGLADASGGLMLDLVVNHVSTAHPAFLAVLRGEGRRSDFHLFEGPRPITWGTRTRTSDIVQRFDSAGAPVFAWCTYGRSQVDLDYRSPHVFEDSGRTLLALLAANATDVRLDAIPHAWKRLPGGPHQPEVKLLVGAFRALADLVDPSVRLMAETDHRTDERSYLGPELAQRDNHLAVPLLLLAATVAREPGPLVAWVNALAADAGRDAGYSFLMTHDGIHLRPMDPPLDADTDAKLHALLAERGVHVTHADVKGRPTPYELNSSLHRILSGPEGFDVDGYLAAQALLMALPGTPSLYLPSLFALPEVSAVDPANPRGANRHRYRYGELMARVRGAASVRVVDSIRRLVHLRAATPALAGGAACEARLAAPGVVHLSRWTEHARLHVLVNVGAQQASVASPVHCWRDMLTGREGTGALSLSPSQAVWLVERDMEGQP